ncbi:hypothetical protein HAX54_038148 [Datura stramonium]|uniref:Uncharacterized protein n=1 Tax=Datura stramonium TaxID=4076 RepID=A0ABS8VL16_DATST|nr:hypothetical protein [Datura stramonium]
MSYNPGGLARWKENNHYGKNNIPKLRIRQTQNNGNDRTHAGVITAKLKKSVMILISWHPWDLGVSSMKSNQASWVFITWLRLGWEEEFEVYSCNGLCGLVIHNDSPENERRRWVILEDPNLVYNGRSVRR